jgi:hypothetical protein
MPIAPWINVEPSAHPAAILGELPQTQGSVVYPIPDSVVPPGATGIMVFAWYAAAGPIPRPGWWHFAVNIGGGNENWFSLIIGAAGPQPATPCNSQVFWLPMPVDGALTVTFYNGELSPGTCAGGVEIHGYSP